MRAGAGQPLVGVIVIVGAALAAIGTLLQWFKIPGDGIIINGRVPYDTFNGFDRGYLTGSTIGIDGKDGIIVLILALAAAGLAVHYFRGCNSLLSVGTLILGVGAGGVAAYNLVRLVSDIRDGCGGCNPMRYIGVGLYVAIAGGVIVAGAAAFGLKRGMATGRE